MAHDLDEGLSLEGLFLALHAMDPKTNIGVYFEPITWRFYILHDYTLRLMIPIDCFLVSTGRPAAFYSAVCRVLSLTKVLRETSHDIVAIEESAEWFEFDVWPTYVNKKYTES